MKRTTPAQKRQRLVALITFGLTVVTMVLLILLDLPDPSSREGLSGTMMESEASSFVWRSGAMSASLDEGLTISLADLPLALRTSPEWRLAATRSSEWGADSGCTLRTWSQGDDMPAGEFLFIPRTAECLDAGPWNVFAVNADGESHRLPGVLNIRSGHSSIELTQTLRAVGHDGTLEVDLAVHRPASADGFDGVHQRPVDLWVKSGDEVCVASAPSFDIPRGTVRGNRSWHESQHRVSIGLSAFQRVRNFDPFSMDTDIPARSEVDVRGHCDLDEGTYQLVAGPTERGYVDAVTFFVHAPPARIATDRIVVSLSAGETAEARFALRNLSSESLRWSAEAADLAGDEWVVGSENQVLKGKSRDRGLLSFSAHNLTPGLYTTDVVVRVDDFYGTEVRIPVEMKVLAARSRTAMGTSDDAQLPGEISLGNYPNPFTAHTTVRLETMEAGQVSVTVYDMGGRQIEVLVDQYLNEGVHEFRFEADNLASGTYIYRVVTPNGQKSETMTLVR